MDKSASFTPVPNRLLITFSVMLATIMQSLDTTIANVALPHMQGSFAASQDQMVWVLTSYIVAAAITIPLTGWLATRYDRKLVFLLSIAGFTVASALCGMSVNLGQIVLFRLLQGISGAALVPLSQAILFDINPREQHGRAMSFWGIGVTLGPILGPMLGGWLTEDYNWRWVFYINIPIGILAFCGLLFFLPANRDRTAKRFDFFGFIALSVAVGALQLMLDRGELKGWFASPEILAEGIVAAGGFYVFLVHTLSHARPFINTALFADANFVVGNVFIFIIGVVLFATLALLPPMLQGLFDYPVLITGLVTAPRGMGLMLAMIVVGRVIGRVDIRILMAIGLALTATSLHQMAHFSLLMDKWPVIVSGAMQGFGIGFVYIPLATVAFATLPSHLRTEGAAFFNLLRNLGSSIGISVVQALLTRNIQVLHSSLASRVLPYNAEGNFGLHATGLKLADPHSLILLNGEVTRQGSMIAYLNDFYLMMVVTLLMAPLLLLFRRGRKEDHGHTVVME
ncbi:DHA2 family efflux MFS transporter permease subunit [Desulfobulbus elongatus]|uniref:DHA2 family efflux MFS transporter permease subunit n=1 Tax=Desulfobulbus elongatus TaxID=53332 RepID=UPI0005553EE0|nr:DHA2 family efflux MFS transporter permease subunit [Desulfobulbus elongatus]